MNGKQGKARARQSGMNEVREAEAWALIIAVAAGSGLFVIGLYWGLPPLLSAGAVAALALLATATRFALRRLGARRS